MFAFLSEKFKKKMNLHINNCGDIVQYSFSFMYKNLFYTILRSNALNYVCTKHKGITTTMSIVKTCLLYFSCMHMHIFYFHSYNCWYNYYYTDLTTLTIKREVIACLKKRTFIVHH